MRIVLMMLAVVGCLAVPAARCGGERAPAEEGETEVVASFYPLAFAAEQVAAGAVSVTNLTPPGAEPHDLELSVRDVARLRSADLVVHLGGGFQPAVEDAAAQAEGRELDVLAELGVEGDDPHVWLDPRLYADVVRLVAEELGDEAGAHALTHRLEELDVELREGLVDCERRELVTGHEAFGYLADAYDLETIAVAGGLVPDAEATPAEIDRAVDEVRSRGVRTIFIEPGAPTNVAEVVAREAGVETGVLHPLETLSDEELERGDDYFTIMRANLASLRDGLACG